MTPRSILAAVDFGEESARAVEAAGFVAERTHASTLRLLHAESMEAPPYFTSEQVGSLEQQRHALHAQAEQYLTRFGRQHTTVPFAAIVETRSPVEAILHHAASADLVVMGTHGRHGPRRWWLGSVAERVLRGIARPLLVVRADSAPAASIFERTLVHAATPIAGDATLHYATRLAKSAGGAVIDARHQLIEPALEQARATLLVAAVPEPRTASWLTNYGEPLVRFCTAPILFVPDFPEGVL